MNNFKFDKNKEKNFDKGKDKKIILFFLENIVVTILLIIAIVLSIGMYYFIYPKYQEIKAIPEINSKEQEILIQDRKNELAKINAIEKKYQDLPADDLDKINFILPDQPDTAQLFGYLNRITTRNGFVLPSITIEVNNGYIDNGIPLAAVNQANGQSKSGAEHDLAMNNIGTILINIKVSGVNYIGLKSFLGQIEKDLRLFDVTNIEYALDNELSLQMQTYFFKK
jgi:hypothetical protein